MFSYNSILSQFDIEYIFSLDNVQNAKKQLDSCENGKIYFTIEITNSIRNPVWTRFIRYFKYPHAMDQGRYISAY